MLALGSSGSAQAAEPIPLAAFFGQPAMGRVTLSPSGQTLTMTVPGKNGRLELVAADLNQTPWRFKSLAWLTGYDVANAYWLNDKRLVFDVYDSQAGEWAGLNGLWAVDADGDNGQMLIDPALAGFRAVVPGNRNILPAEWTLHSVPADGGDDVLVVERGWSSYQSAPTASLARLNSHVPRPQRLSTGGPEGAQRWITDDRGTPQVAEALQDGQRRIYQRDPLAADAKWLELAHFDYPGLTGWTPRFVLDGQLLVASESPGGAGSQLRLWDSATKAPAAAPLLAAPGFDVGDNAEPVIDATSRQLLGWRYRLDTVNTLWIDPGMLKLQAGIDLALPGRVNLIQCTHCLSSQRLLVLSLSDHAPPSYAVLDRKTGRLSRIGSTHADVPDGAPWARSFQRIKARDGRDLPVYLTRPLPLDVQTSAQTSSQTSAQTKAKPRPAVLYIHGGPHSRVDLEWFHDPVPQFLASRGYVVVEPEFRGSAGYGSAHQLAGWRQWGLTMQDDMQDALQWAVEQGLVDGGRVCIMGASFGGYAALMGPVRYPDAYRCAISWVAPTDLPALVKTFRELTGFNPDAAREMDQRIGRPEQLPGDTSPVKLTDKIRVPVLAAWGVDDRRVPISQGRDFRNAASKAKVDLDYLEYPEEGHVWLKPANRIDFMGRAEKLLARTLGTP